MKPNKHSDGLDIGDAGSQGPHDLANSVKQSARCSGRVACKTGLLIAGLALGAFGVSLLSGCAGGTSTDSESVQNMPTSTALPEAPADQAASATANSEPVAQTSMVLASPEPVWQDDFQQAIARAAEQDMPVLVRFSATWCSPCRVMDAKVWPDEQVKATLARQAVPVKIDIDQEATADVVRRYGIRSVPTILLVAPNGDELARGGFMSADALVEFLNQS